MPKIQIRVRATRAIAYAAVLLLANGCPDCISLFGGDCSSPEYCSSDDECGSTYHCFANSCVRPCDDNSDCGDYETCRLVGTFRYCHDFSDRWCDSDDDCEALGPTGDDCAEWRCDAGYHICDRGPGDDYVPCRLRNADGAFSFEASGTCSSGECVACLADCRRAECGSDGCGGTCGVCPEDEYCRPWTGGADCLSAECDPGCSDSPCSTATCEHDDDGSPYCSNTYFPDDTPCLSESGQPGSCAEGACACFIDCTGRECGDDGCGGTCGTCTSPDTCNDGACIPCEPSCGGRVCGSDGCASTCGDCGDDWCSDDGTSCIPLEWVPGTRVTAVVVPQTADVTGDAFVEAAAGLAGASCLDLNDDGVLDNEIGGLTAMLAGFGVDENVELAKTVASGGRSLTFLLTPPENPDRLVAYVAIPGDEPNGWLAQPDAADQPLATLAPVTLDDGVLRSSAEELRLEGLLGFFLEGLGIPAPTLRLSRPRTVAMLDDAFDENGARFVAGTLAGALFKADIDQALYVARVWCATDPVAPYDACAYIAMIDLSLLEAFLTWDLDLVGCGRARNVYDPNDPLVIIGHEPNCQAASLCLFWTGEKARILAAGSQ